MMINNSRNNNNSDNNADDNNGEIMRLMKEKIEIKYNS